MNNKPEIKPKGIEPLKHICMTIGELPSSYLETMTYYEMLIWFTKFLKERMIPALDNNALAVEELQNLYIELRNYVNNYFDNLDVQEEINNKLDQMLEDGTLGDIITEYISVIQPNKNFDLKLGFTSWFHNKQDGGATVLSNCKDYFDNMIQAVIIQYDSNKGEFVLNSANQDLQNSNINTFIQNGGNIAGIKFHLASGTNLLSLFQTYTSSTICQAYGTFVLNFIANLPYKNYISKVWFLNEGNSGGNDAFTSTYSSDIVTLTNRLKTAGYTVSIPMTPYGINKCDSSIINAIDFISINTYPNAYKGFEWENSSLDDITERFNYDFAIIEKYINNKDLVVTEFGCSASWKSFIRPADYYDDGQGKPISLLIEGFFKSKFSCNCKNAWLWYFDNAMSYAPYTLKSIKNNTEVRYAK